MGQKHNLTYIEKAKIDVLYRQKLTCRAIASEIGRGKSAVAV